jgi:glucoamylase
MVRFYIAALVAASIFGASAKPLSSRDDPLTSRIEQQNVISLQGVFNNLGPNGTKAPGAFAGAFIASPSKEDPDCTSHQVSTSSVTEH